jgi:hypothetical protein
MGLELNVLAFRLALVVGGVVAGLVSTITEGGYGVCYDIFSAREGARSDADDLFRLSEGNFSLSWNCDEDFSSLRNGAQWNYCKVQLSICQRLERDKAYSTSCSIANLTYKDVICFCVVRCCRHGEGGKTAV